MKIVLSRKGFDTTDNKKTNCGGVASPIFPDGTMLSLPIPEVAQYKRTGIRYSDIACPASDYENLGILVEQLSRGTLRPKRHSFAHLDPDLNRYSLRHRAANWTALFGQDGGAQTELKGVREGDLFLFFGRFQQIEIQEQDGVKVARFRRGSTAKSMIFGWLSVGRILRIGTTETDAWVKSNRWAAYHPHLNGNHTNNTVYVASENCFGNLPGAGIFRHFNESLQLSAPFASASVWHLPAWMRPEGGRVPLTRHRKTERWSVRDNCVFLRTVSRGQEFVLDSEEYPHAVEWASNLIRLGCQFTSTAVSV